MSEENKLSDELLDALFGCPICYFPYEEPVALPCQHVFCKNCIRQWMKQCEEAYKYKYKFPCSVCKKEHPRKTEPMPAYAIRSSMEAAMGNLPKEYIDKQAAMLRFPERTGMLEKTLQKITGDPAATTPNRGCAMPVLGVRGSPGADWALTPPSAGMAGGASVMAMTSPRGACAAGNSTTPSSRKRTAGIDLRWEQALQAAKSRRTQEENPFQPPKQPAIQHSSHVANYHIHTMQNVQINVGVTDVALDEVWNCYPHRGLTQGFATSVGPPRRGIRIRLGNATEVHVLGFWVP